MFILDHMRDRPGTHVCFHECNGKTVEHVFCLVLLYRSNGMLRLIRTGYDSEEILWR
jgi:hypothetical protein